ncbi:MAG: hypothetical protein WBI34_01770, partial [Tenuifilaceae bacterium]
MKNSSLDVHNVFANRFKGCEALAYALSSKLQDGNMCINIEDYINNPDDHTRNPFFTEPDEFKAQTAEGAYVTHNPDVL